MEIICSSEPQVEATEALIDVLQRYAGTPVLLMLSGGSAWSLLSNVPANVLGPHLTLAVLDERFSVDEKVNNFAQLQATDFYTQARKAGAAELSTLVNESDFMETVREKFATDIKTWQENNPDGVIIATMGIGPDGHTAGIMPGEYGVDFNSSDSVVAYEVPKSVNQHTKRITATYTFLLNEVNEVIVYAAGEQKRKYVELLEAGEGDVEEFPMYVLQKMKEVKVFADLC